METPYGHFSPDGSRFIITTPDIPRNWYNYFYTDNYITFTSQCGIGQGFLQDNLGSRINAVTARGMYAVTDEHAWNLCALPVYEKSDFYECEHSLGSTKITLEKHGIRSEYTLFVPCDEDKYTGVEASLVKITNVSSKKQTIKLISYTENDLDGTYRYQAYNTMSVRKDDCLNGVHLDFLTYAPFYGERRNLCFFLTSSEAVTAFDMARNAFIGTYGTVADPTAIHRGGCTNSECTAEKMGFAVQSTLELDAGESKSICFTTGLAFDISKAKEVEKRFENEKLFMQELSKVQAKYADRLSGMRVNTPDEKLNNLLNYWLQYQTDMGSRWARVRHNGYRDIASDTECLATFNPTLAWERIKRLLTYQYSNGYAPRTFIGGKICDNNFADCTVWLTFTVTSILKELGKPEYLLEEVAFNDGTTATVYEHLRRSVEFLFNFKGLHGLVQIWGGDWNDCMNTAGLNHKGVSVWLSIAWVRANRQFRELASQLNKSEDIRISIEREKEMLDAIEKYGWDKKSGYYIYAYNDDDWRIGAEDCEEGKVFLNPQLWSVLAGGLGFNHEDTAIENSYRLLHDPLGTKVCTPPYTAKSSWVGGVCEKAPGVQENGGVYLHCMCWKLAVDAMRGDSERVKEDLESILPFRNKIVNGRAEPYIICNCYMGEETGYRYGTPGQSWRTASGQWLLKAMFNFVFGLLPTFDGLTVKPCLPSDWNEMTVNKTFRGFNYEIEYKRTGEKAVYADGIKLKTDLLPLKNCKVLVTF